MVLKRLERITSASQVLPVLLLGVYLCYSGTNFCDPVSSRRGLALAAMAIIAGLALVLASLCSGILLVCHGDRAVNEFPTI